MKILGISAYYHDSAAALLVDGKIIAAAQEERFTRRKHDPSFPEEAIAYVLEEAGLKPKDLDYVAFYDKPFLKFERLLETYIALAPRGFQSFRRAMPVWLREKLFLKSLLLKNLRELDEGFHAEKLQFAEHHFSHAASAFYPSPFEEAAVLTLDGVGEWATASLAIGRGRDLDIIRELHFPHSLGLLYSAFTYYLGFKVNSGEYKVMGLAPYGKPRYRDLILEKLLDLKEDGSFRLDLSYFDYATGLTMTNRRFEELFGQPPRPLENEELTSFHMDVAASIQAVTEEIVLRMASRIAKELGLKNLCLSGGVALNCVANGRVNKEGIFDKLWIQPAAGDAGGALGAAYALWHKELQRPRQVDTGDSMQGAFLGPHFSDEAIAKDLHAAGAVFTSHAPEELIARSAEALAGGRALGWFQGRMEFGPRALGSRSILADPRLPDMQKTLNLKVKYRESFRPFAPSVLVEDLAAWFDLDCESPYMLLVAEILEVRRKTATPGDEALTGIDRLKEVRSEIPAVTHVDYSARVQSVQRETNPRYHDLIMEFKRLTGCPVLVNTSFNVRGEPIVCTPRDAFRCFMGTELDALAVGNHFLEKADQDPALRHDYRIRFKLD